MPIDAFLTTADLLPEPMLLVARDGEILAANRGAAERLGLDPRALRGTPLAALAVDPPEEIARYLRACARTRQMIPGTLRLAVGGREPLECRVEGAVYRPRAEGQDAILLLRLVPKRDAPSQFLVLNRTIDDQAREIRRRQAVEEELRGQREWLRVTLASIGDAVIAVDTDGRVTYMNAVAESLTGWPIGDAAGRPLHEVFRILNEETRDPVENPVDKVLREGVVVGLANHTVLVDRSGLERSIDDAAAPIREGDGEIRGVVLVFHDIGDRRAMERELEQRARALVEADRRKDEFLAMLAHELRNPLAPTLNALRLIRSPGREPADVEWASEVMERQVEHMARLVDDLLDVSRITHGKIELRPRRIDLVEAIGRAVEATRPVFESGGIRLDLAAPGGPLPVDADPARLLQILANLLNNAAKYTERGGSVEVRAERRGAEVVVRVRDTGVGIAPELLPHVFDLFVQADRSLARSQGGLGIGLTLVKTLVHLHGGRVEVRSEGLGRGTEFVVSLPLAGLPGEAAPAPAAPPDDAGATRRRVLVVDDNRDSANSLARLLGRWGHRAAVAHDGPGALTAAREFDPQIILLDIGLPGMDGFEVARTLRETHPRRDDLILVALTGYGTRQDRDRSRAAGFDGHLVKPVDFAELRALLAAPGR